MLSHPWRHPEYHSVAHFCKKIATPTLSFLFCSSLSVRLVESRKFCRGWHVAMTNDLVIDRDHDRSIVAGDWLVGSNLSSWTPASEVLMWRRLQVSSFGTARCRWPLLGSVTSRSSSSSSKGCGCAVGCSQSLLGELTFESRQIAQHPATLRAVISTCLGLQRNIVRPLHSDYSGVTGERLDISQTSLNVNNCRCGNCECIATWGHPTSRLSLGAVFWPNMYCACAKTAILQLPFNIVTSPHPNSATPDFLKESNNLAIRRRFHAGSWPLTLDLERLCRSGVSDQNSVPNLSEIEQYAIELLIIQQIFIIVTSRCDIERWPLNLNFCTTSSVTRLNSLQILSELEHSAAELVTI